MDWYQRRKRKNFSVYKFEIFELEDDIHQCGWKSNMQEIFTMKCIIILKIWIQITTVLPGVTQKVIAWFQWHRKPLFMFIFKLNSNLWRQQNSIQYTQSWIKGNAKRLVYPNWQNGITTFWIIGWVYFHKLRKRYIPNSNMKTSSFSRLSRDHNSHVVISAQWLRKQKLREFSDSQIGFWVHCSGPQLVEAASGTLKNEPLNEVIDSTCNRVSARFAFSLAWS